jgi:hypothetical protein
LTITPERKTDQLHPAPRRRWRLVAILAAAALAVSGLGTGLAVSLGGSTSPTTGSTASSSAYQHHRSVIGHYGAASMMGVGYAWKTGTSGYPWMLGGDGAAHEWMHGEALPGFMTGAGTDPGTVMGGLFADAPGPRVTPSDATRLGVAVPAGATVDHSANQLIFSSGSVHLVVLASPSMPDESFQIAGMTDPTVVVPVGARVSIELINADTDMAHGLVVTASGAGSSWMPTMTAPPAFAGAALWFLGESTSAGMHEGTPGFTASTQGA